MKKRSVGERNPMHEQRRVMINGRFDLPQEHVEAMNKIRILFQKAADDYLDIVDALEKRDEGRITAVLDQIQAAKNTGCDAIILPFGPTGEAK